jgi:hypothetical protein
MPNEEYLEGREVLCGLCAPSRIRRHQLLQVAFDVPPVSEWNLIKTADEKLQSGDFDPSSIATSMAVDPAWPLCSGYTL